MNKVRSILPRVLAGVLLVVTVSSLVAFFVGNADSGVLGSDEAVYVFLSRGQFAIESAHAPNGGVWAAMAKGISRTNDPPGVYFVMHYWQKVAQNEVWLRLLPFIFYVVGVVALMITARMLSMSWVGAILCGVLPAASGKMIEHALEFRGYIMETAFVYAAVPVCLLAVRSLASHRRISAKILVLITVLMMGGLASRYPFVLVATGWLSALFITLFLFGRGPEFKANFVGIAAVSFTSFVWFSTLYGIKKFHFDNLMPCYNQPLGGYALKTTAAGNPLPELLARFAEIPRMLSGGAKIFATNQKSTLIAVLFLILLFTSLLLLQRFVLMVRSRRRENPAPEKAMFFFVTAAPTLVLTLAGVAAIFHFHPVNFNARHGLILTAPVHVLLVGVFAYAVFSSGSLESFHAKFRKVMLIGLGVSAVWAAGIYWSKLGPFISLDRMGGWSEPRRMLHENPPPGGDMRKVKTWFVSFSQSSMFKWHWLHGDLKGFLPADADTRIEIKNCRLISKVDERRFAEIKRDTRKGDLIGFIVGKADHNEIVEYRQSFRKFFPGLKCGPYDTRTHEQICYARRR